MKCDLLTFFLDIISVNPLNIVDILSVGGIDSLFELLIQLSNNTQVGDNYLYHIIANCSLIYFDYQDTLTYTAHLQHIIVPIHLHHLLLLVEAILEVRVQLVPTLIIIITPLVVMAILEVTAVIAAPLCPTTTITTTKISPPAPQGIHLRT